MSLDVDQQLRILKNEICKLKTGIYGEKTMKLEYLVGTDVGLPINSTTFVIYTRKVKPGSVEVYLDGTIMSRKITDRKNYSVDDSENGVLKPIIITFKDAVQDDELYLIKYKYFT